MFPILGALARAARDLTHPRVLAVMLVPMGGAIVVWSLLAWYFWSAWTRAMSALFDGTGFARWFASHGVAWILESLSVVAVIALLLPAILITAVLITELIAMPVIVSVVERQYPTIEKDTTGTVVGSMWNASVAVALFAALWLVTLPLWLTGIGALVLPAILSAYLSQRLFRYDALAEHASRAEYTAVVRRARGRLYVLGLLLSLVYYVPLANLVAPVLSGLAFTHLCLAELARLRGAS